MNAVLMVVVTAVVLLMTALTLIFITQGGLSNFLSTTQSEGARGVCISKRDTYCSNNPQGVWPTDSYKYQGQSCEEILGYSEYNCEEEESTSVTPSDSSPKDNSVPEEPEEGGEDCTEFCAEFPSEIYGPEYVRKTAYACDELNDEVTTSKINNVYNSGKDPVKYVQDNSNKIVNGENCECSDENTCISAYVGYAGQK